MDFDSSSIGHSSLPLKGRGLLLLFYKSNTFLRPNDIIWAEIGKRNDRKIKEERAWMF